MSLSKAIATIGGWTVLSRITGLLREMLIARYLGAGTVADAFFVAFRFPNMFRALFAEGAFNAAFVPLFASKLEGEGRQAARQFAEQCFSVLAVSLLAVVALIEIGMPWAIYVLASGFTVRRANWPWPPSWRASPFPICCSSRWSRCKAAC